MSFVLASVFLFSSIANVYAATATWARMHPGQKVTYSKQLTHIFGRVTVWEQIGADDGIPMEWVLKRNGKVFSRGKVTASTDNFNSWKAPAGNYRLYLYCKKSTATCNGSAQLTVNK